MKKSTTQLLRNIYDGRADAHIDLYELSNKHRRKHGPECELFPSDPLQAPLWTVLAVLTRAKRMLEVGCGYGYTAAIMASAGGPSCHVDTIEGNLLHASLAEEAFQERNLGKRITVLRGRGDKILPRLKGHYDLIFLDGDWTEYPSYLRHLRRLTRPGSIIVTANLNPLFGGWGGRLPGKSSIQTYLARLVKDPRFRTYIIQGHWDSISVRV